MKTGYDTETHDIQNQTSEVSYPKYGGIHYWGVDRREKRLLHSVSLRWKNAEVDCKCRECGCQISAGDTCEYAFGLYVTDDIWGMFYVTCRLCALIARDYFDETCRSRRCFGLLWDLLWWNEGLSSHNLPSDNDRWKCGWDEMGWPVSRNYSHVYPVPMVMQL